MYVQSVLLFYFSSEKKLPPYTENMRLRYTMVKAYNVAQILASQH